MTTTERATAATKPLVVPGTFPNLPRLHLPRRPPPFSPLFHHHLWPTHFSWPSATRFICRPLPGTRVLHAIVLCKSQSQFSLSILLDSAVSHQTLLKPHSFVADFRRDIVAIRLTENMTTRSTGCGTDLPHCAAAYIKILVTVLVLGVILPLISAHASPTTLTFLRRKGASTSFLTVIYQTQP